MDALTMMLLQRIQKATLLHYLHSLISPAASQHLVLTNDSCCEEADSLGEDAIDQQLDEDYDMSEGAVQCALVDGCEPHRPYISFPQEDEDDYTDGPARMVDAFDGVKDCGALLITFDLSKKIQHMLDLQDTHTREGHTFKQRLAAIQDLKSEIDAEILNHKARAGKLEANAKNDDVGNVELDRVQYEIDMLNRVKDGMIAREKNLEVNRRRRADRMQEAQLDVNAYLAEAFMAAKLYKPKPAEPELPVEAYDLQAEYAKVCEQEEEINGSRTHQPLDTSRDYLRGNAPQPTPAQQARNEILNQLSLAKERLEIAQDAFDLKEEEQSWEKAGREEAKLSGSSDADVSDDIEAFDLRWVLRNRELTRELVEAEEEVAQAEAAAKEAGMGTFGDERLSCFGADPEDGALLSHDPDGPEKARADPRVRQWLELASEVAMAGEEGAAEVDDWVARDIVFGESVETILFAEEPMRSKIDEWQQKCEKAFV